MTLLEEAGQLIDDAIEACRHGRTQAAVVYIKQARKLYDADVAAVAEENRDLAMQVEALQTQVTTALENERIRHSQHSQREGWQ